MSEQDRPSSRNFKVFSALAKFILPYKGTVVWASIALVVTAMISLSFGQGFRLLIDEGFDFSQPTQIYDILGIMTVMVVLLTIGTFTRFYLVSWIGERVVADIRKAVFDHVVELHPSFFEENLSSEIQSRITTDTTLLQTIIGSSVSIALRNVLLFAGGLLWMFITNPKLTSIVLLSIPVIFIPIRLFGKQVRNLSNRSQQEISNVGSYSTEALRNIKTVHGYVHQDIDKQIFGHHVETTFEVSVQRIKQRSWLVAVVTLLIFVAIGAMILQGALDVKDGVITTGELTAFIFYAIIVGASVGAISQVIGDLQRAAGATERLLELLHAENLIQPPAQVKHLAQPVRGALSMTNLRFCYPSRPDQPALNGVSINIRPGQCYALVGPSGAGKSTLFELLLRFYDPQQGSLKLDGVDISELDPDELRRNIAIVPQTPAIFSTTLIENIRYGNPQATDQEVFKAAKAAYVDEFIDQLPDGYQSHLGEAGVRLSGGQRQRVAIARAILKDAKILLLDEATNALDAQSEQTVQRAIEHLMQDRTTLIIAHRLATIVNADQILVFDQGQIVGQGHHQGLQQSSELYSHLCALQFQQEPVA